MVANENFNLNLNNDDEEFVVDFGETINLGGGGGGTSNFNELTNRPKYDNVTMTSATNIPKVPTKTSDLANTSDYQTGNQVDAAISTAISGKQDKLIAGSNISIANNTISATDTKYSAGTGLSLTGTQFSVNTNTIATKQDITNEATARENADINLQGQIDAISASSDVTDIVGTYAELQAYDTTHLKDNDIIKVLQDESKDGETTYYRWSTTTHTFTLIGEEGPYYTKSATDLLLADKQDKLTAGSNIAIAPDNTISATDTTYTAGTNVQISSGNVISSTDTTYSAGNGLSLTGTTFAADTSVLATQTDLTTKQDTLTAGSNIAISAGNVISATDTTYSNFVGTDGTSAGTAGLVPAPATTDAGKFLKADGTWDTAGGGGGDTVYSTKTTSNINYGGAVYIGNLDTSQVEQPDPTTTDNHYKYFWALPWDNTIVPTSNSINIMGYRAGSSSVAIGKTTKAPGGSSVALGTNADCSTSAQQTLVGADTTISGASNSGSSILGYAGTVSASAGGSVVLGARANSPYKGCVALGYSSGGSSVLTEQGMVAINTTDTDYGYKSSNYRLLTGLYDGQNAHDAVTVGQVNSVIDAINAALSTNIPHIGASS